MLPVYGRSLPVAPAVRTPQITLYPRLTRAYTPDSVRRSSHRSVSAFRRKLHYALSFFLFPRKPASLGVCEVSRAFCLDGLRHICVSKVKNCTKIHRCQVHSSFDGAERRPDDEKAAGNTLCICKDFEDVWASFLPIKTVYALVNRGYCARFIHG